VTDPSTPDAAVRPAVDAEKSAEQLLEIARDLALELRPHRARARRATLDASLERDLGLDSLGRVELWGRVERAFGVRLPESLLGEARTPRDLLAVLLAGGAAAAAPEAARSSQAENWGMGDSVTNVLRLRTSPASSSTTCLIRKLPKEIPRRPFWVLEME